MRRGKINLFFQLTGKVAGGRQGGGRRDFDMAFFA